MTRAKYGNRKVTCLGERFDSILEKDRWLVLRAWQTNGLIAGLERQVVFPLTAHGVPICTYRADFGYRLTPNLHHPDGLPVTEDAKGVKTDVFRLKAKLFEAQYGRAIHIVTNRTLYELPE